MSDWNAISERGIVGVVMKKETRAIPTDKGIKENLATKNEGRVDMEDVAEGKKNISLSVVDEDVGLELTTNRKRRKARPGLEAQVDSMTLDKPSFEIEDKQNSSTSNTQGTFLLEGLERQARPSQ